MRLIIVEVAGVDLLHIAFNNQMLTSALNYIFHD